MNWSKLTLRTCHRKENGGGNRAGGRSSSSSRPSPNESETFYLRARRSWKKKSVKNFSCRDSVKGQRRRWSDACLSQVWSSNKRTGLDESAHWRLRNTFKEQRVICRRLHELMNFSVWTVQNQNKLSLHRSHLFIDHIPPSWYRAGMTDGDLQICHNSSL